MKVRNAKISDAKVICSLINYYAEHDKMLFRSLAEIYENLQTFLVVENEDKTIGCCALEVIWSDLAEIKSLAVQAEHRGRGVGTALVTVAVEQATYLGVPRVFALTLVPEFFERLGFTTIRKEDLPMKVWSDCAKCPKQHECDETAMTVTLGEPGTPAPERPVQRSLWG
jgi:amino-acid N-acetyltransferase